MKISHALGHLRPILYTSAAAVSLLALGGNLSHAQTQAATQPAGQTTAAAGGQASGQANTQANGQTQSKQAATKPQAPGQSQQTTPLDANGGVGGSREIAKAEGKLESQQLQTLRISTEDNKDVFVQLSQGTAVKYTGEADRSWLSPGLMVRFTTKFEQGRPAGAIKSLDVFVPAMRPGMTMEQMREQTPGVYQEGKAPPPGAKGLFTDDNQPKGGRATKQTADTAAGQSATYRVVGRVMGMQGNMLIVMTEQPMQFELDPAAAISVSASDMTFATKGDAVAVSGLRNPAEPALIQAEKIEIKAAKKLAQAQAPARGGRARTNLRGRAAGGDDLDSNTGRTTNRRSNANDRRSGNANKPNGTQGK